MAGSRRIRQRFWEAEDQDLLAIWRQWGPELGVLANSLTLASLIAIHDSAGGIPQKDSAAALDLFERWGKDSLASDVVQAIEYREAVKTDVPG